MYLNATLLAQMTVFFILAWFTMKFVWPPIMRVLDDRAAKIAEGLAAAERGHQTLGHAEKRSSEIVRESKDKGAHIIVKAEHQAQKIIDEAKEQAKVEADKLIVAAKLEMEQEALRLKEALREQVADLAVAGAEKILRREIDAKAHVDLLLAVKQEL